MEVLDRIDSEWCEGLFLVFTDKSGSRMSIGTPSDVPLKITESDLSQLTGSIRTPSKHEEPCALKRLNNGNIGKQSTNHLFILCMTINSNKFKFNPVMVESMIYDIEP